MYGADLNPVNLPPWVAAPFFAAPKTTYVTLSFSPPTTLLIGSDPMRWGLVLSCNGQFGIGVDPSTGATNKPGIVLSQTIATQVITFPTWGPLVQAAWYGTASGPLVVTVVALTLVRWPTTDDLSEMSGFMAPQPTRPPARISTVPGVGGKRGLWDYWMGLVNKVTGGNGRK